MPKIIVWLLVSISISFFFVTQVYAQENISFLDDFNGILPDTSKWEIYENGGNVSLNNGLLELTSTPSNNFPYFRTRSDPFPANQDFLLEFRVKFPSITFWGVGLLTGTEAPSNGIVYNDPIPTRIFTYHTDAFQPTFWFRYLFQNIFSANAIRDNNFHKIDVEYRNNTYKYYFDDLEIFSINSSIRPHSIFFGSPYNQNTLGAGTWTSMTLDYIKITSNSPTPPPTRKVVIVPGLGGDWNADAILNCKANDYTGEWGPWNLDPLHKYPYIDIQTALISQHFEPKMFYYDWRKQIPESVALLKNYIDSGIGLVPGEKVDIVGHSLGGLIGRNYIESEQFNNKAEKYLSVGAPHQGTLIAYPPWSAGEIWGDSLLWKIGATALLKSCPPNLSNREIIRQYVPSVQNLLPIKNYLKDKKSANIIPVAGMDAQNNFPMEEFMSDYNTTIGAFAGFGFDTLQYFDVINSGKKDSGNWIDGRPKDSKYFDGDSTVLMESAALYNHTKTLNLNHEGLIASDTGIQEILYFLSTGHFLPESAAHTTFLEPKSALLVIGNPADFYVEDPSGKNVQGKQSHIVFLNPKSGNYKLILTPKNNSTRIAIGQFLKNGQILWKEYKHSGFSKKIGTIKFDSENPLEDPLQ